MADSSLHYMGDDYTRSVAMKIASAAAQGIIEAPSLDGFLMAVTRVLNTVTIDHADLGEFEIIVRKK